MYYYDAALYSNNIDCLTWAQTHSRGPPRTLFAFPHAPLSSTMLSRLKLMGVKHQSGMINAAVSIGDRAVFDFLLGQGCPLPTEFFLDLTPQSRPLIVELLDRFPETDSRFYRAALISKEASLLNFLLEAGRLRPAELPSLLRSSLSPGVALWLIDHDIYEMKTRDLMDIAIKHRHDELMRRALETGPSLFPLSGQVKSQVRSDSATGVITAPNFQLCFLTCSQGSPFGIPTSLPTQSPIFSLSSATSIDLHWNPRSLTLPLLVTSRYFAIASVTTTGLKLPCPHAFWDPFEPVPGRAKLLPPFF